jgi:hypothetical protein
MKLKTRLEERNGQTVFVINRKEWMRGDGTSMLWHTIAQRGCCLGLAAIVEGVSVNALAGKGGPVSAEAQGVKFPPLYHAAWCGWDADTLRHRSAVIVANDDIGLRAEDREAAVGAEFREARGWLVEFED